MRRVWKWFAALPAPVRFAYCWFAAIAITVCSIMLDWFGVGFLVFVGLMAGLCITFLAFAILADHYDWLL